MSSVNSEQSNPQELDPKRPELSGLPIEQVIERVSLNIYNGVKAQRETNKLFGDLIGASAELGGLLLLGTILVFAKETFSQALIEQDISSRSTNALLGTCFVLLVGGVISRIFKLVKTKNKLEVGDLQLLKVEIDTKADLDELSEMSSVVLVEDYQI